MDRRLTRRALASTILGGTVAASFFSPMEGYLERFAPLSGPTWDRARGTIGGTVESPYGHATVTFDDTGIPTVTAEEELAGYYAVGYVQGTDRLFQMDLFRRQLRGQLSAIVGSATLDSDRFYRRMGFLKAAEATWERVQETAAGPPVKAFADGVNTARQREPQPIEFGLLGYEPAAWTPVDTMLMEKQIAWGLTGSFETLRQATLAETFPPKVFEELYPDRLDHEEPIIRDDIDGTVRGQADGNGVSPSTNPARDSVDLNAAAVATLSKFESPPGTGSNSWVISGNYTKSGRPIVANDPHLRLSVPPIWYEQRTEIDGRSIHGVTFPGVPFVVIGENEDGAWGFTNTGADVIDFYQYESNGETYEYNTERREFDTREETIPVAGEPDETIEVRKTVHGPIITEEGRDVAVAWTGLTGTATTLAVYELGRATDRDEALDAVRNFDVPTQNLVYADREGNTAFQVTGRIPRREIDGEVVYGNRIFDGSAPEAEWEGFTPYGRSTWSGFIPFTEKPAVLDPDWIATANQRVLDNPSYPLGTAFGSPFRGARLNNRLDSLVDSGSLTRAEMQELQRDTVDRRAKHLVPAILKAATPEQSPFVAPLEHWDGRMDRDSEAALVFDAIWEAYRSALYESAYTTAGLADETYWPADYITATLGPEASWFEHIEQDREEVLREAIGAAQAALSETAASVYGDRNTLDISHPFQQSFLGYPTVTTDGSSATVFNVRRSEPAGSSWRMVAPLAEPTVGILPGGNSGDYFDPHYADQLTRWAEGMYRELTPATGEPDIRFREETDD